MQPFHGHPNPEDWSFLGGLTWADGGTSFSANASHGVQNQNKGDWNLYSLVLRHDLNDALHFTLRHDYGWAEKAVQSQTAEWCGLASYLTYDLSDTVAFGIRGEWFREDFRASRGGRSGTSATYPRHEL